MTNSCCATSVTSSKNPNDLRMSNEERWDAHLWIGRIFRRNANAFPGRCGVGKCPPMNSREMAIDRKSTRLNSSHVEISYAVFCLKKKKPQPAGKSTLNCRVRHTIEEWI